VLVDHDITPSQARNLETATGVEAMDRTAVILEMLRRRKATTATTSLELNRDPLGSQFLNDSADAFERLVRARLLR
jgi:GTP-binding protein HflX